MRWALIQRLSGRAGRQSRRRCLRLAHPSQGGLTGDEVVDDLIVPHHTPAKVGFDGPGATTLTAMPRGPSLLAR